jgi:hypothetical protein
MKRKIKGAKGLRHTEADGILKSGKGIGMYEGWEH